MHSHPNLLITILGTKLPVRLSVGKSSRLIIVEHKKRPEGRFLCRYYLNRATCI
ncbi:MAG: hypothetical protein ACI88A_000937 [Paraglaciecola sp.]|jgi:hypothetical protein